MTAPTRANFQLNQCVISFMLESLTQKSAETCLCSVVITA